MLEKMPLVESSWVDAAPQSCVLPTSDRPLRLAEWDGLFGSATIAVQRTDPLQARLRLRVDPRVAARAADLTVRETQCCSFFTFTLTATRGQLTLDVSTPAGHVGVLDALVERARAEVGAT